MKKMIAPALALALFVLGSGCQTAAQSGSDQRTLEPFTGVGLAISADVYYHTGTACEVKIEGDPADIRDLITEVEDGYLKIRYEDWRTRRSKLTLHITSPGLDGVKVSGSGHFNVEEDLRCEEMELAVSGSGHVNFRGLEAEELEVKISGSGNVNIEGGSAGEMDVKLSGSGRVNAERFSVEEFSGAISGSGGARVTCTEDLEVRISGSGSVEYHGSPRVDAATSGSGKVRSL
ncbi:MAG: head GIN domain-containing protein [Bacteroidales bacterium]